MEKNDRVKGESDVKENKNKRRIWLARDDGIRGDA